MSRGETRRSFLRSKCLATAGATGSALLAMASRKTAIARASERAGIGVPGGTSSEQRLRELGIELPPPPRPVAVYVPAVLAGNILFTAGHTPRGPDGSPLPGKVGADMTVQQGYAAARIAGLNLLSTVRDTLGSLDEVVRLVKVLGMASLPGNMPVEVEAIFEVRA